MSELITEYDQLKALKLTYHTVLMDTTAIPEYSKQKGELKVEQ